MNTTSAPPSPVLRRLGFVCYEASFAAMRRFTEQRGAETADEIWLLQHPPVFTQGQAGRPEHLLDLGDIPLVQSDRGGQVTYHGPGQLVGYLMFDLHRLGIGIRRLVQRIEQALVDTLEQHGIAGARPRDDAPGVYLPDGAKIASLGLRVRQGCTFHGLALNVDMDLQPFARINPCGMQGQAMTQMRDHGCTDSMATIGNTLAQALRARCLAPLAATV
ncbi:lipoyl(octanoyl) transferase LipB [Algiphilus sp.]|uniref:lipoyl(octanoyl) transferase LipB n=2 Tax=Algiphilus sp. TaxID=1872431 RepID=UPI001CA79ABE|nr:lipoyl(octanoyl) transferase LipB [Algiphilus sp.]MBY8966222.1 lipoyl(octanoyl) transferase LipB [Algiphilus acroporae]MCI5063165.1 lipoyl(octanoyl) transferase LipB [Algiphilus sp.]MCI5104582.1 lipoyl(octanoyl) transferase LipB [Algiphilus sp.]MCR9091865.1 lipoyl(octanoyl) transferase LipB [Pseudomonadota bacterium]